jgi:hypothetical protein
MLISSAIQPTFIPPKLKELRLNTIKTPDVFITRPSAWLGKEMVSHPERWLTQLTPCEINDLETAAKHFIEAGTDIADINIQNFLLPTLSSKLVALRQSLINGIGFEVIRGLPVNQYDQKMAAVIFCGLGCYLGKARSQNAQGHILGHVRNLGMSAKDHNTRIYQTAERQTFHTDSADVVGLLCLKTAKVGGKSLLVSSETIYNQMRVTRPDLLALLFEPIATDRRGEVPEGEKPYFEIPVFNWHHEKLTSIYQRQYIDSAQRFPEALRLTDLHIEALDTFDALANNPDLHFSMQLQPGDMQFVYNHALLHDREGFTDWPEADDRRHLLRLWLSLENDRELPECFKQRYGSIEVGNRGGIITQQNQLRFTLTH